MKQTAVEWLVEKLKSQGLLIGEPNNLIAVREAKEMEKQQQDKLAIEFAEWLTYNRESNYTKSIKELLEIYKNNRKTSQETINSIIDVLNTQGVISEGDEPVLIEDDCTCDKCGKESRGSHSCPFDEEFNSGAGLDSCNCCDSCRRECLMDI